MELRSNLRRHDGDVRPVGQQARKLPSGDPSTTNEENSPTAQIQKDRIHDSIHAHVPTR